MAAARPAAYAGDTGGRVRLSVRHDGDRPDDRRAGARQVAAETRQILTNMGELLEAAGSSLAKVVKANALIYSMLEYENMNSVYREFFPVDPPARTVCGAGLIGGHKVEIECVALA